MSAHIGDDVPRTERESSRGSLSVAIPCYNHAEYIEEALTAILSQSRPPTEVLVLDDASTDASALVVEQLMRESPAIRLLRNRQNMGVIYSLNRLLTEIKGDFAYFGACDDVVLPGFFQYSMELLEDNPSAGNASGLCYVMSDGEIEGLANPYMPASEPTYLSSAKVRRELDRVGNWIVGSTVIYRTTALREIGGFPYELRSVADSFCATVLAAKHGSCFIPVPVAIWRRMPGAYSVKDLGQTEHFANTLADLSTKLRTDHPEVLSPSQVQQWTDELRVARILSVVASSDLTPEETGRAVATLDTHESRGLGMLAQITKRRGTLVMKLTLLVRYRLWHLIRRKFAKVGASGKTQNTRSGSERG